jgi:glycosyltransferase involved in cell wall biosynthesis
VRSDLSSSSEAARANLLQRLGLREDCPVVLHVGTVLGRRHVPELIQATALLDRPCQLVVVGQNKTRPATPLDQLAQQAGMTNRFVHLPYIETEELSALYSLADVYVSLSDYEGFGLPVLEAAACSTPALVLDSGASRELWADHAHFVASSDPISVARAIQQVLDQPELGRRDRPGVLARHTWKACAAQVLAALQEIAR